MTHPLATVKPHGTVVIRRTGPGGLPLLLSESDRHGTLLTAADWDEDGRLRRAKVRIPDGRWIGIEAGAAESPLWGRSDRLWLLAPDAPFEPLEPITHFQSVEYGAVGFIPPLAEPARLPPGAGTAVLNFLACLLVDQGRARVNYGGPYPTEQLFPALLESFRYDPAATSPLAEFMGGDLAWSPAPHERLFVPPGIYVQLRDGVEKVVFQGRVYYRRQWQGVIRDEPRVVREEGGRVVASLWALGEPVEDHLILDPTGEVLSVLPVAPDEGPRVPFSPRWRRALGPLIAHLSALLLRPSVLGVVERLSLEWGPVAGDLVEVAGERLVVSLSLPRLFRSKLEAQEEPAQQVRVALHFAVEVAKLLGPAVRGKAQAALAALPESGQRAAWELDEATSDTAASTLGSSLDELLRTLLSGNDLPA